MLRRQCVMGIDDSFYFLLLVSSEASAPESVN